MRIFRRAKAAPDTLAHLDLDLSAAAREEAAAADVRCAQTLRTLCLEQAELLTVTHDLDRGTAILTFAGGAVLRVATSSPELAQLAAAVHMTEVRLALCPPRAGTDRRLLIFSGSPWTVYLDVDLVLIVE